VLTHKPCDEPLLDKINQAVITLKNNGTLQTIKHRWSEKVEAN
jgi:ABC-type amino acid transport substrate-binding protein